MPSTRVSLVVGALILMTSVSATLMAPAQEQETTRREPQFENEHVRVWKSIIHPKQPLALHRHEHGRTLVALTDGTLQVVDQNGDRIKTYVWERGKAYWLDADPPGQLHADVNDSDRPIEVIVMELKRDD